MGEMSPDYFFFFTLGEFIHQLYLYLLNLEQGCGQRRTKSVWSGKAAGRLDDETSVSEIPDNQFR